MRCVVTHSAINVIRYLYIVDELVSNVSPEQVIPC